MRIQVTIAAGIVLIGLAALVLSQGRPPPGAAVTPSPADLSPAPAASSANEQSASVGTTSPAVHPPLEVAVFTSSDCTECDIVRREVIPQLRAAFGQAIRITSYDVADTSAYIKLTEHERRAGSTEQVTAKLFVDNRYLAGANEIVAKAVQLVQETLAERPSRGA